MLDFSLIAVILSILEYSSPELDPDFLTNTLIDSVSTKEFSKMNLWSKLPLTVNNFLKSVPWYTLRFLNWAVLGGFTVIFVPTSIGEDTITSSGIENVKEVLFVAPTTTKPFANVTLLLFPLNLKSKFTIALADLRDLGTYPIFLARETTFSLKVAESKKDSLTTILLLNAEI